MSFDLFSPQASTSAKFEQPGAVVGGTILEIGEAVQAKEFSTGKPATWPDGSPKMQVRITLSTDERDPQDPTDEGKRNLWVSESGKKGGMLAAIRDAVKEAGADTIRPGGILQMAMIGFDPESKNPQNPRKLYQARYQAPAPAGGMFGGADQQQQQQAPAPYQQQAPANPYQQQAPAAATYPAQQAPVPYQQPAAPAQAPVNPYQQQQQQAPSSADLYQQQQQALQQQQMQQAQQAQYQEQAQQPPALQAPAPYQEQAQQAAPAIDPGLQASIQGLIGMGVDTETIINSLGTPGVTAEVVNSLR